MRSAREARIESTELEEENSMTHDIEMFRYLSTDNLVDTYDGLQTPVEIGPTFACMANTHRGEANQISKDFD